jgi:hypothetical protein
MKLLLLFLIFSINFLFCNDATASFQKAVQGILSQSTKLYPFSIDYDRKYSIACDWLKSLSTKQIALMKEQINLLKNKMDHQSLNALQIKFEQLELLKSTEITTTLESMAGTALACAVFHSAVSADALLDWNGMIKAITPIYITIMNRNEITRALNQT